MEGGDYRTIEKLDNRALPSMEGGDYRTAEKLDNRPLPSTPVEVQGLAK
jgi:hypothetical protein